MPTGRTKTGFGRYIGTSKRLSQDNTESLLRCRRGTRSYPTPADTWKETKEWCSLAPLFLVKRILHASPWILPRDSYAEPTLDRFQYPPRDQRSTPDLLRQECDRHNPRIVAMIARLLRGIVWRSGYDLTPPLPNPYPTTSTGGLKQKLSTRYTP